ncbi:hypothetical protein SESBI_24547 [Sesbania bispinosa]|nr:hypothetical protein SESBI_24547 [Sesbania bispinosa]
MLEESEGGKARLIFFMEGTLQRAHAAMLEESEGGKARLIFFMEGTLQRAHAAARRSA